MSLFEEVSSAPTQVLHGGSFDTEGAVPGQEIREEALIAPRPLRSLGLDHPGIRAEYPWLHPFLGEIDIPKNYARRFFIEELMNNPLARRALLFGRLLGVPWYAMASFLMKLGPYSPQGDVSCFFEDSTFQFGGRLRAEKEGEILTIQSGEASNEVRIFSCDFQVIPSMFARKLGGMGEDACYFAAFPACPSDDIRDQISSFQEVRHVFSAFSYIRFYRQGDDFIITEIQSDEWRYIQNRREKQRTYKHWDKVTMLAFENYVRTVSSSSEARIIFPDSQYITERWRKADEDDPPDLVRRDDFGGISEATCREYYEDLPAALGYSRSFTPVETPEGNLRKADLTINCPWVKTVSCAGPDGHVDDDVFHGRMEMAPEHPFLDKYKKLVSECPPPSSCSLLPNDPWLWKTPALFPVADPVSGEYPRLYELVSEFSELKADGYQLSLEPVKRVEWDDRILSVPWTEMKPQHLFPSIPELSEVHEALLERTFYSPPSVNEEAHVIMGGDCHHPFDFLECVEEQKSFDEDDYWQVRQSTAFKGSHLFHWDEREEPGTVKSIELIGASCSRIESVSDEELEEPLSGIVPYRNAGLVLNPVTVADVKHHFGNLLGLHWFSRRTGLFPAESLPTPLCARLFLRLPIEDEELRQCPEMETEGPEILAYGYRNHAQLLTAFPWGIRAASFLYAMTLIDKEGYNNYQDPEKGIPALNLLMKSIYGLYGHACNLPEYSADCDTLTFSKIAEYISRVYAENTHAAETIIREFGERTLGFIGAVHGAGALLSYCPLAPGEASPIKHDLFASTPFTPSSPFSTDMAGTMHYFDEHTYLPWIDPEHTAKPEDQEESTVQRINLEEWAVSYFWFQSLLRGFEKPVSEPEIDRCRIRLGDWLVWQRSMGKGLGPEWMVKCDRRALNGIRVTDTALQALYEEQYSRGAGFRGDW